VEADLVKGRGKLKVELRTPHQKGTLIYNVGTK
jgi:hypothetical protein